MNEKQPETTLEALTIIQKQLQPAKWIGMQVMAAIAITFSAGVIYADFRGRIEQMDKRLMVAEEEYRNLRQTLDKNREATNELRFSIERLGNQLNK